MMKLISFFIILNILLIPKDIFALDNKILIKVDNEIITSIDILNEINYITSINNNSENLEKNKIYKIARNSLIKEKIKEIALRNIFVETKLDEKDYHRMILKNYSNTGINDINELEMYLNRFSINKKILKKKFTINVYWNKLIYDKFSKNVKIDIEKIKDSLKKEDKQKEYNLSEIVFNLSENENLEKKIDLINTSILNEGFRNTALMHSISDSSVSGGDLGWIKENLVSPQILNKIKNLKLNENTGAIKIPSGFLIVKVNDIREFEKQINFEEELKKVIEKKTNDQLNQFSNIFFNKIKKNIVINEI